MYKLKANRKHAHSMGFTLMGQFGGESTFMGYAMVLECFCNSDQLSAIFHGRLGELHVEGDCSERFWQVCGMFYVKHCLLLCIVEVNAR